MKKTAKIAFIFGTRPEIIKMSSTIRLCAKEKIPFVSIHTGQHYSHNMSRLFLEELKLPEPDYKLNIKSRAPYMQGDHTGKMLMVLEEILLKEMPSSVLVQGDTNTTLAGALVTSKISTTKSFTGFEMKVGHIEAGLRSYDRTMPEEINRVITDHLADHLFAPTGKARDIMIKEGIKKEKIKVTGNTIVDALYHALESLGDGARVLSAYGLGKGGYILLTLHRQENVDDKKRLAGILAGIEKVSEKAGIPVIFPIHPRTVKNLEKFCVKLPRHVKITDPCGFMEFLALEKNALLILTDSGGVQEEACVLEVPCVTLRDSTERPETVDAGANIVAGVIPDKIAKAAVTMLARKKGWKNPFGDGNAASRILKELTRR